MKFTAAALRVITSISAGASCVASLNLDAIAHLLPASVSGPLAIFALGALAVKESAVVVGDWIDNGKRDGSFKG
jgi:hypothetical protein